MLERLLIMAKKTDNMYYNNFNESIAISCEAARMLKEILKDFDSNKLPENITKMHDIEHKGDEKKHELTEALVKAFITPIERDDIIRLSQNIDTLTDSIEDILMNIYIMNVTEIRPEALTFADSLIYCCEQTYKLVQEFANFKKSKTLKQLVIEINHLEEEGDAMYLEFTHDLYKTCKDPLTVMIWHQIFSSFENCFDTCEDVADVIEGIMIENI